MTLAGHNIPVFVKAVSPKTLSLITGEGDLSAVGVSIAISQNTIGQRKTFYCCVEAIPELSALPVILESIAREIDVTLASCKYHNSWQKFPPSLTPEIQKEYFSWNIFCVQEFQNHLRSHIGLHKMMNCSVIIDVFDIEAALPEITALASQLKQQGCSVVVIDRNTRRIRNKGSWDNIFSIRLRRKYRCSKRDLAIDVKKCIITQATEVDPFYVHSNMKSLHWETKCQKHEDLRVYVTECVNVGKTAEETIRILKFKYGVSITSATLGRLKRKWGLRTYRPEKRKRKEYERRKISAMEIIPALIANQELSPAKVPKPE